MPKIAKFDKKISVDTNKLVTLIQQTATSVIGSCQTNNYC